VQLGDTIVELFAMVVIGPFVAVWIVTRCVLSSIDETIPVTSSIKSSGVDGKLLDGGGSIIAVKTLAAPRFTEVTVWVCPFTVNAFSISTLIARPMFCPRTTARGNGAVVIIGVAGAPLKVITLPVSQPAIPCVCIQYVTAGSERLTTMLV
jgi:hypothetical protein